MEVGNGRKVFSYQAPIKSVEPFNAMVFALQVGANPSKNTRAKGLLSTVMRSAGYWCANALTTGTVMATSPIAEKRMMRI